MSKQKPQILQTFSQIRNSKLKYQTGVTFFGPPSSSVYRYCLTTPKPC